MTERTKSNVATISAVLGIIIAIVAAVMFISNANNKAEAASVQVKEVEVRLRGVETTIPRIDEKLANIERMLRESKGVNR